MIISSKKWSETVESKKINDRGKIFWEVLQVRKLEKKRSKIDTNVKQHANNDESQKLIKEAIKKR